MSLQPVCAWETLSQQTNQTKPKWNDGNRRKKKQRYPGLQNYHCLLKVRTKTHNQVCGCEWVRALRRVRWHGCTHLLLLALPYVRKKRKINNCNDQNIILSCKETESTHLSWAQVSLDPKTTRRTGSGYYLFVCSQKGGKGTWNLWILWGCYKLQRELNMSFKHTFSVCGRPRGLKIADCVRYSPGDP